MSDYVVILERVDGPLPSDLMEIWYAEDKAHGTVLLEPADRDPNGYWGNAHNYFAVWDDRVAELDPSYELRLVFINKSVILPSSDGDEEGIEHAKFEYRREPHCEWVRVSAPPVAHQPLDADGSTTAVF